MWILAGLLSSCVSSGKWVTPRSVLQSQPTMAVLALQAPGCSSHSPTPTPRAKAELCRCRRDL